MPKILLNSNPLAKNTKKPKGTDHNPSINCNKNLTTEEKILKRKIRVEEMIKFLLRPNQRHKSKKDYDRKDKKWKREELRTTVNLAVNLYKILLKNNAI